MSTAEQLELQAQQQQLLGALYDTWPAVEANTHLASQQTWPTCQYQRGLEAYRSNGSALAERVLVAAYPTLNRLMTEESFASLARHLWRVAPPTQGDLAKWGGGLAEFLRKQKDLIAHEPHLPDVAALEWALHCAFTAADGETSDGMRVCAVIESDFAIVDYLNGLEVTPDFDAQAAMVYRQGLKPRVVAITPQQAQSILSPALANDAHSHGDKPAEGQFASKISDQE